MHLLPIPFLALLFCQIPASHHPTAAELITKFRKTIGADVNVGPIPYVINYRGERYLYSNASGKLQGESFEFEAKLLGQADNFQKHRKEMEMKIGIVPFKIVDVVDGNSGWYQMNDSEPVAMSKNMIDTRRQREIHVEVFLGTESFDSADWQFSEPKSIHLRGQDAWEFEAKTARVDPITLSFAKQSSLLLRLKTKASDASLLPGLEPKLEFFTRDIHFANWKKFATRMLPNLQVFHDGVLWQRIEPVGVSFPKTIDPKLFVMPESKQ